MIDIVNVRNESSGKIHRRFHLEGEAALASFEADNADEEGEVRIIDQTEMADAPEEAFCKRCFPEKR